MPQTLYLVRHALAAERGPEWPDDDRRPLTQEGEARFVAVVRGLAALDVQVDLILTSPLLRARQTATLLSQGLGGVPVRVSKALAPEGRLDRLVARIRRLPDAKVAVVGHEPGLGILAAHLIGLPRPLGFKKGGVCRIDLHPPQAGPPGELGWFAPPKMLRRRVT